MTDFATNEPLPIYDWMCRYFGWQKPFIVKTVTVRRENCQGMIPVSGDQTGEQAQACGNLAEACSNFCDSCRLEMGL
jgi:hypothetical protein